MGRVALNKCCSLSELGPGGDDNLYFSVVFDLGARVH